MADHLDAPGLTSPMSDPRTDITDVYAFQKPGDSSKSILVLNVNPLAPTLASFFNSQAIYTINIDTDGYAVADRSFRIRFSDVEGGAQRATVHLATGALAARLNDGGPAVIAGAPASFGSQPHDARGVQVLRRPSRRSLLLRPAWFHRQFEVHRQRPLCRQERLRHCFR